MHILDCGGAVVAIGRLGAGGAGVVAVEAEAMGPTVKHMKPIIGDNSCCGGCCKWDRDNWWHRQ